MSIATDLAVSAAAPLVRGAPAAWAEIVGAYKKLNTLAGYRLNIVVSRNGGGILERGVLESAYPTMRHLRLQVLQNTTEGVDVGNAFRSRVDFPGYPHGWRCAETPQTRPLDDPGDIGGGLTVTRARDTAIDGAPMHAYSLSSGTPPSIVKHNLYIGTRTDLPRRQVLMETFGGERTTYFDYYDYGAKISITPPPCQQARR